jgi:hypothetical protein
MNVDYFKILALPQNETITIMSQASNWVGKSKNLEQAILKGSLDVGLVFLVSFILYSRASLVLSSNHFICHLIPTILLLYVLYRFFFPLELRVQWLHTLHLVLITPFSPVTFRDGFIGDILTSTVRLVVPLTTSIVYIIIATLSFFIAGQLPASETSWWRSHEAVQGVLIPLLSLYPLCIRLMQCLRRTVETNSRWPHLGNALKYSSAIFVTSLGIFRPSVRASVLWIFAFIGATLFQFTWDITMDWGLVSKVKISGLRKGTLWEDFTSYRIRSSRLLGSEGVYVVIAVVNLCLRFAWSLTLMPEALFSDNRMADRLLAHIEPLVASLEILRRMMWAVLRVEWEHIETSADANNNSEDMSVGLDMLEVRE